MATWVEVVWYLVCSRYLLVAEPPDLAMAERVVSIEVLPRVPVVSVVAKYCSAIAKFEKFDPCALASEDSRLLFGDFAPEEVFRLARISREWKMQMRRS